MGSARANVAILGGDPVTSTSLEALLQAAGYRARSLAEDRIDELDHVLVNSRILIVAPTPSSEFRKVLLGALSGEPPADIPVVELLPVDGEQMFPGAHVVAWPCSPENLERAVDTALRSQP